MSRTKDWVIDMESYTWAAIEANLSLKDTISYVKQHMQIVDESYIRQLYKEYFQ